MRPTLQQLKNLWLFAYARSSFNEAERWLDILADKVPVSDEAAAIVSAIVIAYARPFTESRIAADKKVVPMGRFKPPPNLKVTHELMLKVRNKLVGHKDALPAPGDPMTPNEVILRRYGDTFGVHTRVVIGVEQPALAELKQLCQHYVQICNAEMLPVMHHIKPDVLLHPPGDYVLMLTEPPAAWIKPKQPQPFG